MLLWSPALSQRHNVGAKRNASTNVNYSTSNSPNVHRRAIYRTDGMKLITIFIAIGFTFSLVCQASAQQANISTTSEPQHYCPKVARIRCKPGVVLPIWKTEVGDTSAKVVHAVVYVLAMFFFFIGISIISDRFMGAIEIITSKEKEMKVVDKATGNTRIVTVKIWNETVSNLSLMALGSSAPEILLSVIEIVFNDFKAGDLGPSTIVGSAAFNLFIITAVCTCVIPDGEVRRIKYIRVFAFTASCSVFAYVWMYLILAAFSPNVIEVWEAVVTFLFFPLLILIAYAIDRNMNFYRFIRKKIRRGKMHGQSVIQTGDGDILQVRVADGSKDVERNHNEVDPLKYEMLQAEDLPEEDRAEERKRIAMEAYHRAKARNPDADPATLQHLVEQENLRMQHKSRAFYRIEATRRMTGSGSVLKTKENKEEGKNVAQDASNDLELKHVDLTIDESKGIQLTFFPHDYTVVESCGSVYLTVVRIGEDLFNTVLVDYKTIEGSATPGDDFEPVEGTLTFFPGETSKTISVAIIDDDVFEMDEYFYVELHSPRLSDEDQRKKDAPDVVLGSQSRATVTILDDDYPGLFTLEQANHEVMETVGTLKMTVHRLLGARGIVRLPYHTVEGTAKGGGEDFEDVAGELQFEDEETSKYLEINIVDGEQYEKSVEFSVVLGEPISMKSDGTIRTPIVDVEDESMRRIIEAGKPALGDMASATVLIKECKEFRETIDKMLGQSNVTDKIATSSWVEQFREAFQVSSGDEDDEDAVPNYCDYVMHYLSLFWKVAFAFVPPTDILGGWACFWVSIFFIGVLTCITGDIASHFGCTVGLADSVVAISFVALGTSLPDTMASKVAAINDETADSSIGNVTGSNSVNVFLGIGVAWSVASIYHAAHGRKFHVEAGTLGFSVFLFCVLAFICIATLMYRRSSKTIAAELGGPSRQKKVTAAFFTLLWVIYILFSALESYCHIPGF